MKFAKDREIMGVCPFCGGEIYMWKDEKAKETRYYCAADKRKDENCRFSISDRDIQVFTQQRFSEKQMRELIAYGFIRKKVYWKQGKQSGTKKIIVKKVEKNGKFYANLEIDWNS